MDLIIKFNSQTSGKDKLARFLQYSSRAIWASLNAQKEFNVELIHSLKSLEYTLSSFRKLLRFGKSFEVFYGVLKSIHYQDAVIAFTVTVSKICSGLFLLADHVIWLARSGLFKNIDTTKWSLRSNKYWLVSLVMNIVRDVYEINRLISSYSHHKNLTACIFSTLGSIRSFGDVSRYSHTTINFLRVYKFITIDMIKNCCDIFIPLSSLGYFNLKLTPRTIGILGAISSLMGIIAILDPKAKLVPQ